MQGSPVNDKLEATTDMWRISQQCFADEIRAEMTLPDKVQLCDITLREGRQLPGVSLTRDQVIRIADALAEAGVTMMQMHHDDPQEMAEVKRRHPHVLIDALVHPTAVLNPELAKPEIDMNFDHGADYCSLAFSFSENQMCLFESMAGARITIDEAIDRAMSSTAYAKAKAGPDRKVGALIQDCTRIPVDRLAEVCEQLVEAGADMIRLDDINGMAIYRVYTHVVREMKRRLPGTEIALHTHNDIDPDAPPAGHRNRHGRRCALCRARRRRRHHRCLRQRVGRARPYRLLRRSRFGDSALLRPRLRYQARQDDGAVAVGCRNRAVADARHHAVRRQNRILASGRSALLRARYRRRVLVLSVHEA